MVKTEQQKEWRKRITYPKYPILRRENSTQDNNEKGKFKQNVEVQLS